MESTPNRPSDHLDELDGDEQSVADAPGNSTMKEVVFRTPVLIGVVGLQPFYESQKVRYTKGSLLNDQTTPASCS